jgi:cell division protein FtsB
MQVSVDQLFSQIGRLQVEKTALEQGNATLAQEVLKLREQLKKFDEGKNAKPEDVTEFPEPPKPEKAK